MRYLQTISCSNGPAFRGQYRTIIRQNDANIDEDPQAGLYRHAFELYLSPNGYLIVIVAFFESNVCRYRHGQRFRSVATVSDFLDRYDPGQHLPGAAVRDSRIHAALRTQYDRQRKCFLQDAIRELNHNRTYGKVGIAN